MKPHVWVPPVVFLITALGALFLLRAADLGGDYRVWMAMAAGMLVTALVQSKMKVRGDQP
ncbi:MAG: hypothetical protein RI949_3010 [Pseudomonadota bacterium]|jgi:hypothetical protein